MFLFSIRHDFVVGEIRLARKPQNLPHAPTRQTVEPWMATPPSRTSPSIRGQIRMPPRSLPALRSVSL